MESQAKGFFPIILLRRTRAKNTTNFQFLIKIRRRIEVETMPRISRKFIFRAPCLVKSQTVVPSPERPSFYVGTTVISIGTNILHQPTKVKRSIYNFKSSVENIIKRRFWLAIHLFLFRRQNCNFPDHWIKCIPYPDSISCKRFDLRFIFYLDINNRVLT